MKHFDCKSFHPDCEWSVDSQSDDEILEKAVQHGRERHGLKEITEELKNKVRSQIREEKAA